MESRAWQAAMLHLREGLSLKEVAKVLRERPKWCGQRVNEVLDLYEPPGVIHGRRGVLASDGERVQCHVCGRWYAHLGAHVRMKHDMEADEYKREFGLMSKTGLISPELAEKRRKHKHLEAYRESSRERMKALSAEEQSRRASQQDLREERRLDPAYQAHVRRLSELGPEALERARAEGRYRESGFSEEATRNGQRAIAHLRKDESYRAWVSRRISEGKAAGGGMSEEVRQSFREGASERAREADRDELGRFSRRSSEREEP
ncbi:ROS/MUCR transcriptional regulator protein (plasmid) [Rubrobacter radiotolerans]|uniref:MucR family transcriptional regulator n=1 Tax=Rubrobacter radiotolerans TaxID=42256 RepID=A0A023X7V4_RUBRA|nr:MucR family transcriptional regulator [Rubrobacter radiotolerans]AHY48418.1 ROS/MUCR transcriptional regulator protein [Rubrobacter radiotolerans]MDX5895609.1 MucR family transcriptional regulator [Rubrobacter radiotolerans]